MVLSERVSDKHKVMLIPKALVYSSAGYWVLVSDYAAPIEFLNVLRFSWVSPVLYCNYFYYSSCSY